MKNFDLQSHLNAIYATFPQSRRQPVIGLTTNFNDNNAMLLDRYYRLVVTAGATPILIPPIADKDVIGNTLELIDGLVLTG